jgi:hypothetical protein
MADAKPVNLAKQRKRKKARLKALAWLRETYPALFSYPPRPLAVGIGKEIIATAIASGTWSTPTSARGGVSAALHFLTNSIGFYCISSARGSLRRGGRMAPALSPA